jgi:peptide/nickel transport system permease protein
MAGRQPTPEILDQIRINYGLNEPGCGGDENPCQYSLVTQYWRFARGLIPLPGFFLDEKIYYSWANKQEVKGEIAEAFTYTAVLTAGSVVLWLLLGIPIGIISALRRRTWADRSAMTFALIGVSFPTFWLGYLLIFFFYYKLGWAPSPGVDIGDTAMETAAKGKYILPWITLAVTSAALYARVVRGNMLETLSEDYIRTAKAKGLSPRRVTYKHAFRASITPVVTMLGLDIAGLLAGAVITEQVFAIPGLGRYAIRSLEGQDFPPVMAVTLLAALFIVVANLVVDVIYAWLDPRVRYN